MKGVVLKVRRNKSRSIVALFAFAAAGAVSALVAACSSSDGTTPAVEAGTNETGTPEPTEDAGAPDVLGDTLGAPCNPVTQDCADPSLRCHVVFVGGDYVTACQPPWKPPGGGPLHAEGEVCNRLKPGLDDCVNGSYCIKIARDTAKTACLRFCAKDSDCAPGGKCAVHTTSGPSFGLCWRACTPFGTECGSDTCAWPHYHIDGVSTFESCREVASGAVGDTCKQPYDCAADMHCQGELNLVCTAMCDDSHPCDGGTCRPDRGLPNNAGVCQ